MRSQVLLCLLLAVVPAALGAPVEGSGDDELTPVENDAGVVLVPVGADDRLDYKIDNDDGSFQYGYQSGRLGDEGGYNFRHEYRREDGVLFGQYGHQLPGEESQAVNYIADGRGYRVLAEGQVYEPVSEEQLASQRGLLSDILAEEEEEAAPLDLNLSLLDKITSSEEVLVSADPEASLAASPLAPYSEMDPDTGAFRFGFRSVGEDGSVTFRQENRRPNGVVVGQYGYRAAGEPGKLVSYVSDAFGYREVDAAAGPVKVVSREQALEQLEEAQEQEATFRAAAEAGEKEEETGEIDAVVVEAAADDTEEVDAEDGAGDVTVVESDGAAVVRGSDDSVVTEALPESVAEPADPQYWSQPPVYASALPYHAGVYPYHPAALPYHAAVYPYHSTVYSYPAGTTGYQFQTVHPPSPTQYQYQPYSAWYPYLTPAATPYQYQHPAANVRAKYQYPAPEYPLYEAHLYSPIVNDDEETR